MSADAIERAALGDCDAQPLTEADTQIPRIKLRR
jgi:hypothetical protein